MNRIFRRQILNNFEAASTTYNTAAELQKDMAWRLAQICLNHKPLEGHWVDLGSGTGLLADALETLFPHKDVLRVDISPGMLKTHKPSSLTQLWDLNKGLPSWSSRPTLLASSFALQWLNNPSKRLEEWFSALPSNGYLAVAIPIAGSFPEWRLASKKANVKCTAMPLPSREAILKSIPPSCIKFQRILPFTQIEDNVPSLFKSMRRIGAQSTPNPSLGIREWRKVNLAWPRSNIDKATKLTWLIQILLIKR